MAISSQPVTQLPPSAPQRFLLKLRTAWQQISDCSAAIAQASATAQQAPSLVGNLRATRDQYDETTRALLAAPWGDSFRCSPSGMSWNRCRLAIRKLHLLRCVPGPQRIANFNTWLLLQLSTCVSPGESGALGIILPNGKPGTADTTLTTNKHRPSLKSMLIGHKLSQLLTRRMPPNSPPQIGMGGGGNTVPCLQQ